MAGDEAPPPIRLVVGLGNPEPRYVRHPPQRRADGGGRAGVAARRDPVTGRYGGRLAEARGPSGPVGLLVPLTFMNESGDSVGPAAGALHAAPEQVLVVHDEIDLPFGTVRGKIGGGAGGHNGLRSVTRGLGHGRVPRVCGSAWESRTRSSAATEPTGCSPASRSRARRWRR